MTVTIRPQETEAPRPEPSRDERHRLTVVGGLAALSLDAMASVAYGPEAIVLVLALAGGAGLGFTLPVTLSIAALLVVLTVSYRQVIAAFPALLPYTVWLCLGVLALVTAINLRGIAHSARAFILPTIVYVGAIVAVVLVGIVRGGPAVDPNVGAHQADTLQTVGILLLLKAFANGCAALTGVEAIANAVPSFRKPRVRRAQHAELVLGGLLAVMLIGIAVLIEKFEIHPVPGVTVLSQVTEASLGNGFGYYLVQFATVVLLALAANTSFGGLPVLAQLLAKDNNLPHAFALRADRSVHRYGIAFLTVTSALLLIIANGQMNLLVPLFAIGVFVGFTLSQVGMVRHWITDRPRGWGGKAALNGFGALLTGIAAVVVTASKFGEGGWLIAVALPLLVLLMEVVHRSYGRIGAKLELGHRPTPPRPERSLVVVPVATVSRLTRNGIAAALSLGNKVIAVHVGHPDDEDQADFLTAWDDWDPGIPLVRLHDERRRLAEPLVEYLQTLHGIQVFVLIPEVEPERLWQRVLQNQRGAVLAHALRQRTSVIVCRLRFRVG